MGQTLVFAKQILMDGEKGAVTRTFNFDKMDWDHSIKHISKQLYETSQDWRGTALEYSQAAVNYSISSRKKNKTLPLNAID